MEYTAQATSTLATGTLAMGAPTTAGDFAGTEGLNVVNYVPLFNMPAAQFASLRTWYGAGFTVPGSATPGTLQVAPTEFLNWYAPY